MLYYIHKSEGNTQNQKGIIMKITRVLTYNIDENYIRNYFDEDWWEDKGMPDETDYDFFIDSIREDGYDDEEIIHQKGDKERIMQIWQEECDRYHKEQEDFEPTKKNSFLMNFEFIKAKWNTIRIGLPNLKNC